MKSHISNFNSKSRRRTGFTLVEVLIALALISIVIPAVMRGIDASGSAASDAKRRDVAAGLAQAKLSESIATGLWQNGVLAGDFNPDWPDYRWEAALSPQQTDGSFDSTTTAGVVQELNLRVIWKARNREESVMVSTLVYQRSTSSTQ